MCIQSQMDNMTECICGYNVGVHMARHKRTCKVIRVTHKLCSEIEELREENIALKARLEEARGAKPNVNVQMQNNVIFNVYGQEDSLANEQVGSILCSLLPIESVPKYIKMKHFSKPENANHANIRISLPQR